MIHGFGAPPALADVSVSAAAGAAFAVIWGGTGAVVASVARHARHAMAGAPDASLVAAGGLRGLRKAGARCLS